MTCKYYTFIIQLVELWELAKWNKCVLVKTYTAKQQLLAAKNTYDWNKYDFGVKYEFSKRQSKPRIPLVDEAEHFQNFHHLSI